MPSEKEIRIIQQAAMYNLRCLIKQTDKETFTKEEMLDLIDTVAMAKDQEN